MARTSQEVDALIDQLVGDANRADNALQMQGVINEENTRRFDRVVSLYERLTARLVGLTDQHEATVERVSRVERQLDEIASPIKGLALGLVALIGWLILGFWLKSYIGGSAVWLDGQEILWNQHPQFGGLTTAIIGGVAVFIVVLTLVNILLDITSGRRPRQQPRPAQAEQPEQEEQANPPVRALPPPRPVNAGQQP
jgi:hypothetical protein